MFFSSIIPIKPEGKVVHQVCRDSPYLYFSPPKEATSSKVSLCDNLMQTYLKFLLTWVHTGKYRTTHMHARMHTRMHARTHTFQQTRCLLIAGQRPAVGAHFKNWQIFSIHQLFQMSHAKLLSFTVSTSI